MGEVVHEREKDRIGHSRRVRIAAAGVKEVLRACLGRDLAPRERAALAAALAEVTHATTVPTVPEVALAPVNVRLEGRVSVNSCPALSACVALPLLVRVTV